MSEPTRTRTAAMVVIGNEILSGKVVDSNSPFLAKTLRSAGVSLERIEVIPDDIDTIGVTVAGYANRYDYVFTSGGVGPTHDDLTIEGVARGFGKTVVEHPRLRRAIESIAGSDPGAAMLKMAEIPEGADLVDGGSRSFPTVVLENVYILPGIPEIFEKKIEALVERFQSAPFHLRQIYVAADETEIADFLHETLAEFPDLLLGSYPKLANPEFKVRLTLESKDEKYLDRALQDLISRMPDQYIVRVER